MSREKNTIKLHELRQLVETDATRRNGEQEKTIHRLIEEGKQKDARIKDLENRCYESTGDGGIGTCEGCEWESVCGALKLNKEIKAKFAQEERDTLKRLLSD